MLSSILSVLFALIPAVLLLFFVVGKDKKQPEPPSRLVMAFLAGVASMFVASVLTAVMDFFVSFGDASFVGRVGRAFGRVALPEELAKFLMLWLVLRKNKYFDEHYDGIVYAVMVGLGFATVGSLLYVLAHYAEWLDISPLRALTTVPAQYAFAVFMGYFYSLANFAPRRKVYYYTMALFVPIMLHGLYDLLLMVGTMVPEFWSILLSLLCIVFCYYMHKEAYRRMTRHLQSDSIIIQDADETAQSQPDDGIEYVDYEETKHE